MNDFQALGRAQGDLFQAVAEQALKSVGLAIAQKQLRLPHLGIEVDFEMTDAAGRRYFVECKGSWRGHRPGVIRTDSTKKGLLSAYVVAHDDPTIRSVLISSHAPKPDNSAATMIANALKQGVLFSFINCGDPVSLAQFAKQIA